MNEVYGTSFAEKRDPKFFKERAILSPRNQDVDSTNEYMLSQLSGSILVFKILNFVTKIKACNLIYPNLYC